MSCPAYLTCKHERDLYARLTAEINSEDCNTEAVRRAWVLEMTATDWLSDIPAKRRADIINSHFYMVQRYVFARETDYDFAALSERSISHHVTE